MNITTRRRNKTARNLRAVKQIASTSVGEKKRDMISAADSLRAYSYGFSRRHLLDAQSKLARWGYALS